MDTSPKPRLYYGARKRGDRPADIDLNDLRLTLLNAFEHFESAGFFVEAFGSTCVDAGFEPGFAGSNVDAYVKLTLGQPRLWPIAENVANYGEDDVFTVIEFCFDHVSKPQTATYHSWDNCGYHYSDFDRLEGQREFKERINVALGRYEGGWELTDQGEILSLPPQGLKGLVRAPLPTSDKTVQQRVEDAKLKFRRHGSALADRRDAVRDLADVLEWLRPQLKTTLMKEDENDLFNIANNFGIRHMNQKQKRDYDPAVWLSWMFYFYLNTIAAVLHLIKRQNS